MNIDLRTFDPVKFCHDVIRDPQTGKPFELYPGQKTFLREALRLGPDGRFLYTEWLAGLIKKSGKSTLAAILWIITTRIFGGRFAEGYALANDFDGTGRVFTAASRIVEASPILAKESRVTSARIEFLEPGTVLQRQALDYSGGAGTEPTCSVFDELWGYTSEAAHRLWDEFVPPPTRACAARLTVTYAGFEGESDLLWNLYQRGLQGTEIAPDLYAQPGMLMWWSHRPLAPWQTPEWIAQMRQQLRPNAFLRMIENRWVSSESGFVEMEWWDACVDPSVRPVTVDSRLSVWGGLDASYKRDSSAVSLFTWDQATQRARQVYHRIWQPSPDKPLDFEKTIEATVLDLRDRFHIRELRFDPYQMIASAQRLTKAGVNMVEFPQTTGHLTEASNALYELIKGRNLVTYPDSDIRLAISRAVAIEGARGWRIAKEKASHKIDVVVAMAQAALGATQAARSSHSDGPQIVCNALVPESVAAMERYMRARLSARRPVYSAGYGCATPTHPRGFAEGRDRDDVETLVREWTCPRCGGPNVMTGTTVRGSWDPTDAMVGPNAGYGI